MSQYYKHSLFLIALTGCDKGGKDEESLDNVTGKVLIEVGAPQTNDWALEEIVDTRARKSADTVYNDKSSGLDMQLHTTGDASWQTLQPDPPLHVGQI